MTYQSVNPYNGKTLKTFKELTDKQLDKALERPGGARLMPSARP